MGRTPLVFLGTPEPAAVVLGALVDAGHDIVHVVTGADKRRGRGGRTSGTPVKDLAMARGIPVSHDLSWFGGWIPPDLRGVVVAYGRIIPMPILEAVPMWNVHFSLLPRWRGAAPVARAILAGDARTGVCIMEMEEGLDTGGVLGCTETAIEPTDTTESLTDRLAHLGAARLLQCLEDPTVRPVPQQGNPTYAHKISAEEGRIDWTGSVDLIDRQVRALRAFTSAEGKRVRVLAIDRCDHDGPGGARPGEVLEDGCVVAGDGTVRLVRVQEEGRPVRDASDWLRGWRPAQRVLGMAHR